MAKMTLLEIVQKVLVSINGDEVSSISDTVEAMSIANIVEDVYFNLITNTVIPEHRELLKVEGLASVTYPNYLQLPAGTENITSFRYDNTTDVSTEVIYKEVKYVSPEDFINRTITRLQSADNVVVVTDHSGVKLLIQDDKFPDFWTSFDDYRMVFDSYNSDEDTTMQESKSMAFGTEIPTFTLSDSFTPDLDANLFPMLLNECKSWAHLELRQQPHQKAEQQSRRQRVTAQNDKDRFKKGNVYPSYGRK